MLNPQQKSTILEFLRQQPLATISTVGCDSHVPQSALIAFCETESLELVFETFVFARKYANLLANPHVALVIGWDPVTHITLQYEGIAKPIPKSKIKYYQNLFLQKSTPCTEDFVKNPQARLFKVQPTWLRYSDYTKSPAEIWEGRSII